MLGAILKGAGLHALVSAAAFMIVIVGTVAAICVQTPMEVMRRALCDAAVDIPAADARAGAHRSARSSTGATSRAARACSGSRS